MRERRRLLERLEHPVGGLVVHRVDALEHEHAAASPRTACARRRRRPARRCRSTQHARARRVGTTQVRSGCAPRSTRARARSGSGAPSASSSAANARATVALAGARGAVEAGRRARALPAGGTAPSSTAAACGWRSSVAARGIGRRRVRVGSARDGERPADHDRGPRRRRQDDARRRARSTSCASAGCRSSCCASRAASRCPSASARSSRTRRCAVGARAEALLYAAARAQLVEERLQPLLERRRAGCCSTASSTPRSPTRAAGAGSGSRRSRELNALRRPAG